MALISTAPPRRDTALVGLSGATVLVALLVATSAPLATTVLGLIVCGLLHHVLEYRYLAGRFTGLFSSRVWILLGALITGILLTRSGLVPHPVRTEIVLGYLVVAAGVWWGLRGHHRAIGLVVIAAALTASWLYPSWHFVVLTHLHNVLPVCFLWEWSRRLSPAVRRGFLGVQLLWVAVLPVVILSGLADAWLNPDPGLVAGFVGDGQRLIALHAPPDAPVIVGTRFLTVFALMQSMHYVTWILLMPALTPDATAVVERRVPALRGWRIWALGLGLGVLLGVIFVLDWFEGRATYGMLASYHAYLEYPILLALLLGGTARIGARSP